jgi:hypothetical protein
MDCKAAALTRQCVHRACLCSSEASNRGIQGIAKPQSEGQLFSASPAAATTSLALHKTRAQPTSSEHISSAVCGVSAAHLVVPSERTFAVL